jgi:hypothetical protein
MILIRRHPMHLEHRAQEYMEVVMDHYHHLHLLHKQ